MPILLEGTAVVIRNDALDRCLEGGAKEFQSIAPNAMSFGDGFLSQASFMSRRDAELFLDKLVLLGLKYDDVTPEVVVVDAHTQTVHPPCDWLQLLEYNGNLIANLVGNQSDVVVAPETWDPERGPTLKHMSADEVDQRLEFVRRDDKVDVYRDTETGKLLYSARIHDTPEELFQKSADVILNHLRHPGQPPLDEVAQRHVRDAIGTLQRLAANHSAAWRVWFLLGKGWHAVDRPQRAITALERAADESEQPETMIFKELAGLYLETGDMDRACRTGEKAVALRPDDVDLLGNLCIAYFLTGRDKQARATVDHALKIDPANSTNRLIVTLLDQVAAGRVERPGSLSELEQSAALKAREQMEVPAEESAGWFAKLRNWLAGTLH